MITYWISTPPWLRRLFPGQLIWELPSDDTVYLSFDDGPHPTATPYAMQQLAKYNAKATFFCVGNNVSKHPELYAELLAAGHATGNHTYDHMNGIKATSDQYLENINKAAGHISHKIFRPPYGRIKRSQARRLHADGWKIYMWNVLSADFDHRIAGQQCVDNVLKYIKPGAIVIFHDSQKAWDRMSYALPKVLEHCQARGWKMKALPY